MSPFFGSGGFNRGFFKPVAAPAPSGDIGSLTLDYWYKFNDLTDSKGNGSAFVLAGGATNSGGAINLPDGAVGTYAATTGTEFENLGADSYTLWRWFSLDTGFSTSATPMMAFSDGSTSSAFAMNMTLSPATPGIDVAISNATPASTTTNINAGSAFVANTNYLIMVCYTPVADGSSLLNLYLAAAGTIQANVRTASSTAQRLQRTTAGYKLRTKQRNASGASILGKEKETGIIRAFHGDINTFMTVLNAGLSA